MYKVIGFIVGAVAAYVGKGYLEGLLGTDGDKKHKEND